MGSASNEMARSHFTDYIQWHVFYCLPNPEALGSVLPKVLHMAFMLINLSNTPLQREKSYSNRSQMMRISAI